MIRAARNHKVKLMIAYRLHFEQANLKAVEIVKSGKLGEPRFFNSLFGLDVKEENIRTQADLGVEPSMISGSIASMLQETFFRASLRKFSLILARATIADSKK